MKKYNVCLVGASGLVGRTLLNVLEHSNIEIDRLELFASEKSKGNTLKFRGRDYPLQVVDEHSFDNFDFVFFTANKEIASKYVQKAVNSGAVVIDNSSLFRNDSDVPLLVPSVNFEAYCGQKLISNPNCSTIQSVEIISPIYKRFGLTRVDYTTFQSISGLGQKGLTAFDSRTNGEISEFFGCDITSTCVPQIGKFTDGGYTEEELKMINETKKILNANDLKVSATCVRVPVRYCHGVSVRIETKGDFTIDEIKGALSDCKHVYIDDSFNSPISQLTKGTDSVYVGRIRRDLDEPRVLYMYCVADNLYTGAAANAVEIAEYIVEKAHG